MENTSEILKPHEPASVLNSVYTDDYSTILVAFGLPYKQADGYWQVGEITRVQGWILHIAIIRQQTVELLNKLIPFLVKENMPFKVPVNAQTTSELLSGGLGYAQLGKVVCIYPPDDVQALRLAQQLISLTAAYKGPDIPTDRHLGALVHTRYGSFNPILKADVNGNVCKFIYNASGELVEDSYAIPFSLPEGITWPFSILASPRVPEKKLINDRIKQIAVLKSDAKGKVLKGIYLKNWLHIKYCLVKEGKKCMYTDNAGRDIQDKLEWQLKLHQELAPILPVPKVLDFFRANGDAYFVTEFVNGISLEEAVRSVYAGTTWTHLSAADQLLLLDYLLKIISMVQILHQQQIVHRDIMPGNFLIDKKGKLWMIDLELAYSMKLMAPDPPFKLGTLGFMSPEQEATMQPTEREDIYAIGALMIVIFTSLLPSKFNHLSDGFAKALQCFIPHSGIIALITSCMQQEAQRRPALHVIVDTLQQFQARIKGGQLSNIPGPAPVSKELVRLTINNALQALCSDLMTYNDCWTSRVIQTNQQVNKALDAYTIYTGLYEGVSGCLYLLAQLKQSGFAIGNRQQQYYAHNLNFIYNNQQYVLNNVPGLYTGTAGVALALANGLHAVLTDPLPKHTAFIKACLDRPLEGLDLAGGAAGKGIAILGCMPYLPEDFYREQLSQLAALLLKQQQKDGSWLSPVEDDLRKKRKVTGLAKGVAGITWFLLHYAVKYKEERALHAAVKALKWLQQAAHKKESVYTWQISSDIKTVDPWVHNGITGIALAFIKAFEYLQEPVYKQMAVGALRSHPHPLLNRNLTHAWGLSGIGEAYLEAARVFQEAEWQQRADWITQTLLHVTHQTEGGGHYWKTDNQDYYSTADFMTGNSGIIHFLARYLAPDKLFYPLLTSF